MKAKDYATQYLTVTGDKNTVIGEISYSFANETLELIKSRKLQTKHALQAVFAEQRNKWKSFCRQINGEVKESGFDLVIETAFPELKEYL